MILVAAVILVSCSSKPFRGRIVDKEYVAGHRCHTSGYMVQQQASLLPSIIVPHVPVIAHPHHHSWIHASVTVWVANRNGVKAFYVDTTSYGKWIVGSKVTFK